MKEVIAFIGGGNLARSLIGGLIASGHAANKIKVSNRGVEKLQALEKDFKVITCANNSLAVKDADIIVIAVKPQMVQEVSREVSHEVQDRKPLVISLAAGIQIADLQRWLGGNISIVRSMSNTPALIRKGATGLYGNDRVQPQQKIAAEYLLKAVGEIAWVREEALLEAITPLVSSGPAYIFLIMEAIEKASIALGLDPDIARRMTLQTALGAVSMVAETGVSVDQLRRNVTTPNGVTERAINKLVGGGMFPLFVEAMQAAKVRCEEFGIILGKDAEAPANTTHSKL